jgi:hypothetical protein
LLIEKHRKGAFYNEKENDFRGRLNGNGGNFGLYPAV